jgi:hypothetical protein
MLSKLVGGRSSTVESKLVELVVAGSNPVGHPTFVINSLQNNRVKLLQKVTTQPLVFRSVFDIQGCRKVVLVL